MTAKRKEYEAIIRVSASYRDDYPLSQDELESWVVSKLATRGADVVPEFQHGYFAASSEKIGHGAYAVLVRAHLVEVGKHGFSSQAHIASQIARVVNSSGRRGAMQVRVVNLCWPDEDPSQRTWRLITRKVRPGMLDPAQPL